MAPVSPLTVDMPKKLLEEKQYSKGRHETERRRQKIEE
jgi:hypothetical protein